MLIKCSFLWVDKDVNPRCSYMSLSNRITKWFLPRLQLPNSVRRSDSENKTNKIEEVTKVVFYPLELLGFIYIYTYIVSIKWMTACIYVYASPFLKRLNQINVHFGACSNDKENVCSGSAMGILNLMWVNVKWTYYVSSLKRWCQKYFNAKSDISLTTKSGPVNFWDITSMRLNK